MMPASTSPGFRRIARLGSPARLYGLVALVSLRGSLAGVLRIPTPGPFNWIYNGADLARTPVIWARDRGEILDRRVLAAYPDRVPLLLLVNGDHLVFQPYPAGKSATSAPPSAVSPPEP
jgi:hypothetical protein